MVRPSLRSRSIRKSYRKTPGGKTVAHFEKKRCRGISCGRCGKYVQGTKGFSRVQISKLSKSEKIPTRPFAGVLCSNCTEDLMRYVTRFEVKFSNPDFSNLELQRDLTLEKFLPRNWHSEMSSGKKAVKKIKEFPKRKKAKTAEVKVEKKPEEKEIPKKVKKPRKKSEKKSKE